MRSVIWPIRRVHNILIVLGVSLGTAIGSHSFNSVSQAQVFAEDPLKTAVATSPSPVDPDLVRQAEDFFIAGAEAEQQENNAEAENAYLRCSQFAQEHQLQEFIVPAYHRLAVLKAKLKQYDQSEAYFKKIIPDCGENVPLLSDYAKLYINQKRYNEAETILKNIILFAPTDQQVLYNLGYVIAAQPDRQIEGLRYMKLALGEKEAYREIAKIYRTHGQESQATFAEQRSLMNSADKSASAHASPEEFKELQEHIKKELIRKEVIELAEEWERENAEIALGEGKKGEREEGRETVANPIPDPFMVADTVPVIALPTPNSNPTDSAKIVKVLPSDPSESKNVVPRETKIGQIKTLPQPTETTEVASAITKQPDTRQVPTPGPPVVPTFVSAVPLTPVPPVVPTLASMVPPAPVPPVIPTLVTAGSPAPGPLVVPMPQPQPQQNNPSLLVQGNSLRSEPSASGSIRPDRQVKAEPTTNQTIPDITPVPPAVSIVQESRRPKSMEGQHTEVQHEESVSATQRDTAAPSATFKLEFVSQQDVASAVAPPQNRDEQPILTFRSPLTNPVLDRNEPSAPVHEEQPLITPEAHRPSFALRSVDSGEQASVALRPRPAPSPALIVRSNPATSPATSPAPVPEPLVLKKPDQPPEFVVHENASRVTLSKENPIENSPRKAPVPELAVRPKLEFVHEQPKPQEGLPANREGLAARTIAKAPVPEIIAPAPIPDTVLLSQQPIVPDVDEEKDMQQAVASNTAETQPRPPVAWSQPIVEPSPVFFQEPDPVAAVSSAPDPGIVCFELSDQPSVVWSQPVPERQQERQIAAMPTLSLQAPTPVFVPVKEKIAEEVQLIPVQSAKQIPQPSSADATEQIVKPEPVFVAKRESEPRNEESPIIEEMVRSVVPPIAPSTLPVQQDVQVPSLEVAHNESMPQKPVRTLPSAPMPIPLPMPEPMPEIDLKQSLAKLELMSPKVPAPEPPVLPKFDDPVLVAMNMESPPQYSEAKIPSSLFDSRAEMDRILEALDITSAVSVVDEDITEIGAGFATTSKGSVNSDAWEVLLQELVKADKATTTSVSPSNAPPVPTKPIEKVEKVEEKNAVIVKIIDPDEMDDVGFARSGQYAK